MCWFCDDIKKFINKSVVVYDNTTTNASKEYSHFYSDDTVMLKITAGGYRGNSHILTGMRELNGLRYCPNCGEKIEDFDNFEKLKRDVEDLKKDLDNVLHDVEINLAALRRIDKKISEIESSKIFKYIKED